MRHRWRQLIGAVGKVYSLRQPTSALSLEVLIGAQVDVVKIPRTEVGSENTPKALANNAPQRASTEQELHGPWPIAVIDRTINDPVALFTLPLVVSTILL